MIFCFLKITDLVQHFNLFLTVFYFVVDTLDVNLVDINLVYQLDKLRVTIKGNRYRDRVTEDCETGWWQSQ